MYNDPTASIANIKIAYQVLFAIILGILVGLFFGERLRALHLVAPVYIMLVQAVVYPYIISSIIYSLGRISPGVGKKLFKCAWFSYFLLLLVSFALLYLLALAVPRISVSLIATPQSFDKLASILNVLVPANLFEVIFNNYVPAAIVFCVLFGLALQRVDNNRSLLDILVIIRSVSMQIWIWIIRISPLIVFAMSAYFAGTISYKHFLNIEIYLILYFVGTLLLAFVFIPLLFSSFTPFSYKQVLHYFRPVWVVALATLVVSAALPLIVERIHKMLTDLKVTVSDNREIDTITMIGYPLAHVGNLFLFLFVVFSAYFFHVGVPLTHQLALPIMTLLASFGSSASSVNAVVFLNRWLHLPIQANNLYVELMALTRYGQVLASSMGISFFAALTMLTFYGKLQLHKKRLALTLSLVAILFVIGIPLSKEVNQYYSARTRGTLLLRTLNPSLIKGVNATVLTWQQAKQLPSLPNAKNNFIRIRRTHVMRVGFNANMWPFVYFNKYHQLVGYDVAFMYALAESLHAKIIFVPFMWQQLVDDIKKNKFDIAIGSIYVTGERLQRVAFTNPYYIDKFSLLVKNKDKYQFESRRQILQDKNLRIAVFNDPVLLHIAKLNFHPQQIVVVPNYNNISAYPVDAVLWTLEHTQALAKLFKGYTSVVPIGLKQTMPLMIAFMVNKDSADLLHYMNYWLDIQRLEGFSHQQYQYWIRGIPRKDKIPRWNVLTWLQQYGIDT